MALENAFNRTTCHQCGTGLAADKSEKPQKVAEVPKKEIWELSALYLPFCSLPLFCGFAIWGISGLLKKEEVNGIVQNVEWQYNR